MKKRATEDIGDPLNTIKNYHLSISRGLADSEDIMMFIANLLICSVLQSQCLAISTKVQFEAMLDCKNAMNEMIGDVRMRLPHFQVRGAHCEKLPGFSI